MVLLVPFSLGQFTLFALTVIDELDKKCSEIDAIITEKESLMSDLEQFKRALIYDTVTGKRKVV